MHREDFAELGAGGVVGGDGGGREPAQLVVGHARLRADGLWSSYIK